jgi:MFS family permease
VAVPNADALFPALRQLPPSAWLIGAGALVNRIGSFHQPFLVVYVSEGLGLPPLLAGAAVAGYGLGSFLSAGIGGYLADRMGKRATIVASRGIAATSLAAVPLMPTAWLLMPVVVLAGFGTDLYRPATLALLAEITPLGERTAVFGLFRLLVGLGYAVAVVVAGLLAAYSLALVFFADAAIALAIGALAWLVLPVSLGADSRVHPPRHVNRPRRLNREFGLLLLASCMLGLVFFQKDATLPLAIRDHGHSLAVFGLLMSIQGVVAALVAFPVVLRVSRLPPRTSLSAAAVLVGLGFGFNAMAHSAAAFAALVALWSFGEVLWTVVAQARAADDAPAGFTGRYLGMLGLTWSLGLVLGPLLGAAVYSWSPVALWLSCGVGALFAAMLAQSSPASDRPRS